jgi:F5/8 type C domain.
MRNIYIAIFCLLLAACSKDDNNTPAPLPKGSISFNLADGKDTIQMPLSILADSAIVFGFKAALSGSTSGTDHWVNFAVDTTKIAAFRSTYGSALLLPVSSWLFYKPMTKIAAGASLSDSAQLNIGLQTKLIEYSTYVLPVVIQSVDGNTEDIAARRTIYLVFKTGKPLVINRTGFTIAGSSSTQGTFVPANLIDNNDLTTYWASNITLTMPQWVAINFNRNVLFTGVNYTMPTLLKYPTLGGYPTSIKIETSMDGTAWTDRGTYAGNVNPATGIGTLATGEITARYLRFTSLACVKYSNAYDAVFIGGISLVP